MADQGRDRDRVTVPVRPKRQDGASAKSGTGAAKPGARCPVCGKPVSPEHRPFCSKRCADIDLGRWLKGGYAVPGAPVGREDRETEEDD